MKAAKAGPLDQRSLPAQWLALIVLSTALVALAEYLHVPAALLIGPMLAATIVAATDGSIRVPGALFVTAQGVIGCLIGRNVPLSFIDDMRRDWPLHLFGIVAVIAAATILGLVLVRWSKLPGTTAIWGMSPGAAPAMILMSESYGGDIRLVALMQYMRVVGVALVAAVITRLWSTGIDAAPPAVVWFPAVAWLPFIATMLLACVFSFLAVRMRLPAGAVLLPMAVAVLVQEAGWLRIELPQWLLAVSFGLVGWHVGLRFTRPILLHALKLLPTIVVSAVALIALCALIAGALVIFAGLDPLTAYLATCPGGLDTVAIIAASSNGDLRFIMAMQTTRLIVVMIVSPVIARFLVSRPWAVPARKSA